MAAVSSVTGGRQLREVSKRLREAGDVDLRKELTSSLKTVPGPIVRDLQEAVRHVHVRGLQVPGARTRYTTPSKPKGLRERVAQAITSKLTTSGNSPKLTLQAVSARLPESMRNLPRYLDNGSRRPWRHPIQGNRERWAQQEGQPWWWKTIEPHLKNVRQAASDAIEHVASKITKGL